MIAQNPLKRHNHLSFKGNLDHTRYGWLRLTPAYSVHLVSELIAAHAGPDAVVLDPFCGTGTTALSCAEQGIACDTTDINPFLLWLSRVKTYPYSAQELDVFKTASTQIVQTLQTLQTATDDVLWIPPLYQIEKWWDRETLFALAHVINGINELTGRIPETVSNLLKIAFCRTMIERSNASFGHQSMSFKKSGQLSLFLTERDLVVESWERSVSFIAEAAVSPITREPRIFFSDARNLHLNLEENYYSCVITSPPYPNRMSYIRELRPYMYWLGYLTNGRDAGELDWQAIGGTWGCATSNLNKWEPDPVVEVPFPGFNDILERIARHSPILSRYVHKYFHDMVMHCNSLFRVVRPGGRIIYIVGNSKFYDVLLPVDSIFASLFAGAGFEDISVRIIRKRSSKKELFEFAIAAKKPV
ncbi:MAG: SAM-dependent methyltransferase [Ktedonobacteraceae bacterium]|nr:SAM-dependent methyltransferase [Ktedonobacteraceae bacterium]